MEGSARLWECRTSAEAFFSAAPVESFAEKCKRLAPAHFSYLLMIRVAREWSTLMPDLEERGLIKDSVVAFVPRVYTRPIYVSTGDSTWWMVLSELYMSR